MNWAKEVDNFTYDQLAFAHDMLAFTFEDAAKEAIEKGLLVDEIQFANKDNEAILDCYETFTNPCDPEESDEPVMDAWFKTTFDFLNYDSTVLNNDFFLLAFAQLIVNDKMIRVLGSSYPSKVNMDRLALAKEIGEVLVKRFQWFGLGAGVAQRDLA